MSQAWDRPGIKPHLKFSLQRQLLLCVETQAHITVYMAPLFKLLWNDTKQRHFIDVVLMH